ncbi:hypothetical protein BaRGS_00020146, partial [Batillaria attramentaria]
KESRPPSRYTAVQLPPSYCAVDAVDEREREDLPSSVKTRPPCAWAVGSGTDSGQRFGFYCAALAACSCSLRRSWRRLIQDQSTLRFQNISALKQAGTNIVCH